MANDTSRAALCIAIRAALEAGKAIRDIYNDPSQDFGLELKADNSPLTRADKAAHHIILRHLSETGVHILSEEGSQEAYADRRLWDAFWCVDPLDGTKEFIKRNGEFTVNIALVLSGRPHLGVIYVPVQHRLYFGCPFLGAFRVDDITEWDDAQRLPQLLERAQQLPLPHAAQGRPYTIVASRSHLSPETQQFIDQATMDHGHVQTLSAGSSLKICLVAEGTADAYPRFAPTMEWDTAAGHAIAACAGRQVYHPLTRQPLEYNKEDLHNPWFIVG